MKRFFLIILLSLAVCLINAATLPFTVEPVKWTKLAKSNTDGVNIRKAPSTTAPRYVYQPNNEPTDEEGKSYWSAAKLIGNEYAVHFEGKAPVVSEVDGWYELKGIGPDGSNGWVSAKYCDVVNLKDVAQKVVPGEYNTPDFVWIKLLSDESYYAVYSEYYEMDGYCAFYVGREIDGFVVCPYVLFCYSQSSADNVCDLIDETGYGCRLSYGDNQNMGRFGFDIRKFPKEVFVKIIDAAKPMNDPVVIYRSDGSYVAVGCEPLD